jgi:hypothetical protein
MRWMFVVAATVLLSTALLADPVSVDSLPGPVRDSLKTVLQNPQETVANIETYDWGPALIYKISVTLNGQPYLEVHIADTGQILRTDENPDMADKDDGDDSDSDAKASPTSSPQAR